MRIFLLTLFIFLIYLVVSPVTFARQARVLGDSQLTNLDLPLSEGPGLLLPDNPFYFLDLWRDNLNLLLASFTPETKARLHLKIAAERIMELKMMLVAKNVAAPGLDTALANITQNIEGAAGVLKAEKNKGRNITKLASELNQTIDQEQEALRIISKAGDESLRFKIAALESKIADAEIEVEDDLNEDELKDEVTKELEQEIKQEVEEASESAQKIEQLKKIQEQLKIKQKKEQEAEPTPKAK